MSGALSADVVVIGGGYAGMWAAWHLLERGTRVALLEADLCGHGPSGRNGGFVDGLWHAAPRLSERFGAPAALALGRAAAESVQAIGEWCQTEGVDAWYRASEQLVVAAAPAQDGAGARVAEVCSEIGASDAARSISAAEIQRRCASPVLRAGVAIRPAATVQPARLALGLRQRLLDRGALVFERSPVNAIGVDAQGGVVARTSQGQIRARAGILAIGCAALAGPPLDRCFTGASSHLLITEPVPDVLEELGWTGGEPITDGRALVHYFRTTPDGRIAFGWGGGPILPGGRTHGRAEVDTRTVTVLIRDLHHFFPMLAERRIDHAWGGPIDASPWHLPVVMPLGRPGDERVWATFGFTGNGVGPSHLVGRILAQLALGERDSLTSLPIVDPPLRRVPPEPWRFLGGTVIRSAIERRERAQQLGRRPDPVSALVADLPRRLGYHIGR